MKFTNFTAGLVFALIIFSCQNEPKPRPDLTEKTPSQTETSPKTETTPPSESTTGLKNPFQSIPTPVTEFGEKYIVTQQGEQYYWAPAADSDTTTIIILRHGETVEGKTTLDRRGKVRGGRLASSGKNSKIKGVFYSNNSEIQMGQYIAKEVESDFIRYEKNKPATILEKIKNEYKGSRTMLIGNRETSTDFVNRLAGKSIIRPVGQDYYDKVYVCYIVDNELVGGIELNLFKLL